MDGDLASLKQLLRDSNLKPLDDANLAGLRHEYPDLPTDYFDILSHCGFGGLLGSRFMLYSGPIPPEDVFDPEDPICQAPILLVGDDFSGGHLGYLKTSSGWLLCSFDHLATDDLVPETDTSIVRFLLRRFQHNTDDDY